LTLNEREVELVVKDGQRIEVELVEFAAPGLNRIAADVHVGLRLQ
jgi:hypothetical protein